LKEVFDLSHYLHSKKNALIEAATNSIGGYPVGFIMGLVILPLSVGWIQKDPITSNLIITMLYVGVSFVRSYFLRRVFLKYKIEDNFLKAIWKFIKRSQFNSNGSSSL